MMDEWYVRAAFPEPPAQPVLQSISLQTSDSIIGHKINKLGCYISTNIPLESSPSTTGASSYQQMTSQHHKDRKLYSNNQGALHNNTSPNIVEHLSFVHPSSYSTLQKPNCNEDYHESYRPMMMMVMKAETNDPQRQRQRYIHEHNMKQNHLDSWIGGRSQRITAGSAMGSTEIVRDHSPGIVTVCGSATSNDDTKSMTTSNDGVSAVMSTEVTVVTPSDVLFGRGKFQRAHEGNEAMRTLVYSIRSRYEKCLDRDDKTSIARYIVKTIQQSGGRFLKHDNDRRGWRVVSDEEARQKISHVMRDDPARKHRKSCTKMVSVSTSTIRHGARWQPYGTMISPASLKLSEEEADFLIDIFSKTTKR